MHVIFSLILPFLLSLYACSPSTNAVENAQKPDTQRVTITYIANEGVLISSGDKQVLIDGLHREYKPDYAFPPKNLLTALETAQPPYNEIDLVLVSHLHLDHFHPESVGLHLKNNPRAQLLSSEQIADGVKKEYGDYAGIEKQVRRITPEWKTKAHFSNGEPTYKCLVFAMTGHISVGFRTSATSLKSTARSFCTSAMRI